MKSQPANCLPADPSHQSFLGPLGWLLTFIFIPFGSAVPGFLILLAEHIRQLFCKQKTTPPLFEKPRLVVWTNRLFIILIGVMLICGIFSPKPFLAIGFSVLFGLVFYVFVFGGQSMGMSAGFTAKYLPLLGVSSVLASIIALTRYFLLDLERATNIAPNSWNGFGTILIFVGGIITGYLSWRGGKWRYLIFPYLALIIATLVATKSRGGWAGFIAMLGCLSIFKRKMVALFLIFIILTVIAFLSFPPLMERLTSTAEIISRTFIWRSTWRMIQDHPLTGIGNGVYPIIYKEYLLPGAPESSVSFSHNLFLQVTAELGLIGLLVFSVLLILILKLNYSLAKTGNPLYQGIFASIIGVLVHQQVDLPIWGFDIGGAFWMLVGVSIGLYRNTFQQEQSPPTNPDSNQKTFN